MPDLRSGITMTMPRRSTGQLVSGSFQNYCMPRADQFCTFDVEHNPTLRDKKSARRQRGAEAGTKARSPASLSAEGF